MSFSQIQKIVDDVAQIKKAIEACGQNAKCLAELATKMEQEIVDFPSEIMKDVNGVVNIVQNYQQEIKQCGTDAVSHCTSQGKALLTKISACITDKIIHH